MALDKDKIAKNALKFIQKGQFARAIEEYKRALSSDPRDIRLRLKLIDLYGRTGKKKESLDECHQVAESYAEQGFYLKAIAVYKQALRIDAMSPELYRDMGELYVKQGLVGDALGAFKRAVELERVAGRTEEAERLLTRMEEMAPENAAIKIHLAELYLSDGRYAAFEAELEKIVLQLRGEGRTAKLLQALEGFHERSSRHPSVVKRLAELYVDLHEEEKALELVKAGLAAKPGDRELRLLAMRAHLTLGNLPDARRVGLGLYEEEPEDLYVLEQLAAIAQARKDLQELAQAYKTIAKIYERQDLPHKAEAYYRKTLEVAPGDAEARLFLGDVIVAAPKPKEEPPEDSFWKGVTPPPSDDAELGGLAEAELYLKYGLEDKAGETLRRLAERSPDNLEIREKLRDHCRRRGDRDGWVREQLHIAEVLLGRREEERALKAYQEILEVDPANADARKAIQYVKPSEIVSRPTATEIDLSGNTLEFVEAGGGEIVQRRTGRGQRDADEEGLREGLAEADFYVAQELEQEAISVLLRLRERYPRSEPVASRLARLGWKGEEAPEAGQDEGFVDLQAEVLDGADMGFQTGMAGFQDLEISELEDIVREFKSGIAERLEEGDFETHYNLGTAYREMGLLDEAVSEFQIAARSPEKARDAYTSMALVFRESAKREDARAALRMALAVPTNTPDDRVAILFELGEVSEEDNDLEAALQAFRKAAAIDPGYREVGRKVQALTARQSR